MDKAVYSTGTPTVVGVPGFIIPQGLPAQLFINASSNIRELSTDPTDAVTESSQGSYSGYAIYQYLWKGKVNS